MPRKEPRTPPKTRADGPWYPVEYEIADAGAIQALMRGEAGPEQQRRALAWIIEKASGTYDVQYYPGDAGRRDTDFALGSRFVGQQIIKLSKLNLSMLTKVENEDG